MSIPLLDVAPKTQNQRVPGFEVPNEDAPQLYRFTETASDSDVQELIWADYRQIFSEHLILEEYRQLPLESQLRNRQLSVREFVRALGKSDVYRREVADTNSNYRLVDISFKRFLGRATYNKDEQIAWSIVIATKGLHGFIDAIIDGEEYRQNFGDDIVPYQSRRFNERPFNLVNPRYSDYWRTRQIEIEGRSYYKVQIGGQGVERGVRSAIPNTFLEMAKSIAPSEVNYQRSRDRVLSQVKNMEIPDMTRKATTPKPAIGRTDVALPYRYISPTPKV